MYIDRPHHSSLDIGCDCATPIEAIFGDGVAIDPVVIVKGVSHLGKWYTQTSFPGDYLLEISAWDYANDIFFVSTLTRHGAMRKTSP